MVLHCWQPWIMRQLPSGPSVWLARDRSIAETMPREVTPGAPLAPDGVAIECYRQLASPALPSSVP
jgi:hypothetical protein